MDEPFLKPRLKVLERTVSCSYLKGFVDGICTRYVSETARCANMGYDAAEIAGNLFRIKPVTMIKPVSPTYGARQLQ